MAAAETVRVADWREHGDVYAQVPAWERPGGLRMCGCGRPGRRPGLGPGRVRAQIWPRETAAPAGWCLRDVNGGHRKPQQGKQPECGVSGGPWWAGRNEVREQARAWVQSSQNSSLAERNCRPGKLVPYDDQLRP